MAQRREHLLVQPAHRSQPAELLGRRRPHARGRVTACELCHDAQHRHARRDRGGGVRGRALVAQP
eukprot:5480274-Prymnesium_polylepis.1